MSDGNTPDVRDVNTRQALPDAAQEPEKTYTDEALAKPSAEVSATNGAQPSGKAPRKGTMFEPLVGSTTLGSVAAGTIDADEQRHARQQAGMPNELFATSSYERGLVKDIAATPRRYKLNLIIALEWVPRIETAASLKDALREASRLLADVTDDRLYIGEVVLGGPQLMACADIQIFASNRLFPRSSVDALNDPAKYRPIRLGRGLWHKNSRSSISWSAQDAYATIVHELGHHVLGLKDQYLKLKDDLVLPVNSLVKDTIMSSVAKSELLSTGASHAGDSPDSEWEALRQHKRFRWLGIPPNYQPRAAAPRSVPETMFKITAEANGDGQELILVLDEVEILGARLSLDHSWVYLLKDMDKAGVPGRLIAQGSFESRSDGFRLLGAEVGDRLLLCGKQQNGSPIATPLCLEATILGADGITALLSDWEDVTPISPPTIDVTASSRGPQPPYEIGLQGFSSLLQAYTFPLGERRQGPGATASKLEVLDGNVMLVALEPKRQVAVASYSLGGSPGSAYPAHPNPIPAGSSDGNAMLLFHAGSADLRYVDLYGARAEDFQIVTTTNHNPALNPPRGGAEPRSYVFSVTTNLSFEGLAHFKPTLVLYYDERTRDESSDELWIYRYNPQTIEWERLSGCYDSKEGFLLAAPLVPANAPGLFGEQRRPEHYCIFLTKPGDSRAKAS